MDIALREFLYGFIPPSLGLFLAVWLIQLVCRRTGFRPLILAMSLSALAGAGALLRALTPGLQGRLDPYLQATMLLGRIRRLFNLIG